MKKLILAFAALASSFLLSCGPSLEMTRLVPSAYDIGRVKRVSVQKFEGGSSSGFSFFNKNDNHPLEDSLYNALGRSRLFSLCSPTGQVSVKRACSLVDPNPVEALFTGRIYNFGVRTERYLEKREREEATANGTRKVTYTVPYIRKRAELDVEIALIAFEGGNLGSKRYTESREETMEEANQYSYSDESLKNDLIHRVTEKFFRDLTPHSETYNVGLNKSKEGLREGQQYLKNQQWLEAKRFYENYLRSNPGDDEAHYSLGLAYEMDRQYDQAAKSYQRALSTCSKECKNYEKALKRVEGHRADSDKYKEQVDSRKEQPKKD